MAHATPRRWFDGHNDTIMMAEGPIGQDVRHFLERQDIGHLDLVRAREGGLAGGVFAVFVDAPANAGAAPKDTSSTPHASVSSAPRKPQGPPPDQPLAPALDRHYALDRALAGAARLFRLEAYSQGQFQVIQNIDHLERCLDQGVFAAVLHLEGAEAIDTDLDALEVWRRAGLRSLGLVWSRPNAFGCGVPFRYGQGPDIGPGLTDAGRRLVRACNRLGVVIDLSHLNAAGFRDVAELSEAPLVASHSNAFAVCPVSRNLTDDQLDAIAQSGGLVGINFCAAFLRADGLDDLDTPLADVVAHARYLADRMGVEHVAIGSDFDGAGVPRSIGDAAGAARLFEALDEAGFSSDDIERIALSNWLRVFRQTWKTGAET